MKGPLDSLCKMQRHACLWITGAFKNSPIGTAKTLAGMAPIHLHVEKLVQATYAFCHLVDGNHKFSVKTLKGQIRGDLKSPIAKAWLNLDFSMLDLDPVHRFNQPGLQPKTCTMGTSSTTLYPLHPRQIGIARNSWMIASTCFTAVSTWPPTLPSTCALSQTHLPLPYPSSQSQPSASGMRGTSMTTGLQLVLLCLTMFNCKQLQTGSGRPTMLAWRMYIRYMSSSAP
jgi:hypothetical protein